MNNCDIYSYGMTALSTSYQLKGPFPAPNEYQDFIDCFVMTGGEAANSSIVLQNLGANVVLDGCYFGEVTEKPLRDYLTSRNIDCSLMKRLDNFDGWQEIIFCDGKTRTTFGRYATYLSDGKKRWSSPSEAYIQSAKYVSLDPFFGEDSLMAAELCAKYGKEFVTVDCPLEDRIAKLARANVISQEFLDRHYHGQSYEQLFEQYLATCPGLILFTFGDQPLWYGSSSIPSTQFNPYKVDVVDTLGAGDAFRGGITYGLFQGLSEPETVRFAAACAAIVCTRFPCVHYAPTLDEIYALISSTDDIK
jgi:sugar/nucleoside kinase (ribokinase family)